ncbi:hypothetical protein HV032_15285 [Citrobacter freundii]|uniref:hypothetical protein n=1 Tax=Citrobacter sp. Res13-Lact-LER2-35-b TaxID=2777957 RepID=UPI0015E9A9C3|nr:hypothetical protein [Citrobacter sp. Res13-Lact-LER2-35-b]QMA42787.1 hypothetical protein HV032_15285 [Citrobacter freundii]
MGKMTLVVEFDDGKEPPVSADMDVAGGRLVAASWSDYRDDFFTASQRDVVIEALNELSYDDIDDYCHSAIIEKAEILTY